LTVPPPGFHGAGSTCACGPGDGRSELTCQGRWIFQTCTCSPASPLRRRWVASDNSWPARWPTSGCACVQGRRRSAAQPHSRSSPSARATPTWRRGAPARSRMERSRPRR
jgi:hypothetical protein